MARRIRDAAGATPEQLRDAAKLKEEIAAVDRKISPLKDRYKVLRDEHLKIGEEQQQLAEDIQALAIERAKLDDALRAIKCSNFELIGS